MKTGRAEDKTKPQPGLGAFNPADTGELRQEGGGGGVWWREEEVGPWSLREGWLRRGQEMRKQIGSSRITAEKTL